MVEGSELRGVAAQEGVPEDLDADLVGTYEFPDPLRRRTAGWIYSALAVTTLGLAFGDNPGWWAVAALASGLAAWHLISAWPLELRQEDALRKAAPLVPFAVGHASAAVTFHGVRARPRWHVVLYSAEEPPRQRALVIFEAGTGEQVGETYLEEVSQT